MNRSRITTIALLFAGGIGLTAAAPVARPNPLMWLTMTDTNKLQSDEGCAFSFETPVIRGERRTMVYSIENTLMVKTKAGVAQCRIPARAMNAFRDTKGPVTCGGQQISLKRNGKLSHAPEGSEGDGSSFPATLMIGTGPGAAMVKGDAGTGC